ncbi:MAG: urease accessory protein UreE [Candidatus Methylacidiphilales bacterium]|nr:hypothetical protein [Candidatus Methylacidiphilales bacterium]
MQIINRMVSDKSQRPEAEQIKLIAERSLFLKRRWRGHAEDGTEFGFDLESRLRHGSVFHQTELADYIICQQAEQVYQVSLQNDPAFAALAGWKIGNLHFPVQITEGWLRTLPDPAISQLFEREGWSFEEVIVVFNPLRAVPHAS